MTAMLAPATLSPELIRLRDGAPGGVLRGLLLVLLALFAVALAWAALARLDIVATAGGKLVPAGHVKIVQPADAGVVDEIHVAEGRRVREGELLMRLNAVLVDADARSIGSELARRRLELRRIDAELRGEPLRAQPGDDAAQLTAQTAQAQADLQALHDAQAEAAAALDRTQAERAGAERQREQLRRMLPMLREQDAAFRKLVTDGYAGRLMHLDKERELLDKERELAAQEQALAMATAAVDQARRRLAQLRSGWQQRLQAERVEVQAQIARLTQEQTKAEHRGRALELRAPHAGIVKDLATHTRGSVVQPGAVLMTLVPDDQPLQAEVWLGNADVGFVAEGQMVQLKLAAYPFQKYGLLEGRITHIGADATEARPGEPPRGTDGEPVFKLQVALQRQQLDGAGQVLRLAPGMAVAAEIHQGTRSVLEYLLSPVQKVTQEAARER